MAALALAVLAGCLAQETKLTSVLRADRMLSLSAHPAPPRDDNATKSTNNATSTPAFRGASAADTFLVDIKITADGTLSECDEEKKARAQYTPVRPPSPDPTLAVSSTVPQADMEKQMADAVSVKPNDVTLTVTEASTQSISKASRVTGKRAHTLLATTADGVKLGFAVVAKDQSAVDSIKILAADVLKDAAAASSLLHVTATSIPTVSVKTVPSAQAETTNHFGIDKYMTWERADVSNNTKCLAALWEEDITTYEAAAKCEADPDICKGVVFKYDEDRAK
tara:strand:- start:939 stop:1781 length:843 start_codon:yes stop_codon:yes gene_type:complete